MSRKPGKAPRAASSKGVSSFGASSFGAFSSASSASGTNLSYLAEPPEYSFISDANVVVSLKNLLKKDPTTKAKALDDLLAYVQDHPHDQDGGVEEPVVETWVQMYPRISIDNSRRVRELSHIVQLELMKSARKRMEKHVPRIVGSWLAGTFDRDKPVSRAASEGLSSFLNTPGKVTQFWRRCQQQILDYASDAIKETPETLSDLRSTSADDAETKYHRVLGASIALVLNLLRRLDSADIEKYIDSYDLFFESDKVWASALVNDPNVRRHSCQLLSLCIEKRPARIEADLVRLSKVFIAEGLKSNQTGSAIDYLNALTLITSKYPTVWTSDYKGKKSPASRLKVFLESGSQSGPPEFWSILTQLFAALPQGILPQETEGALDYLKAMRKGLTSRDEPRSNAVESWSAYLALFRHFIHTITSRDERLKLAQEGIYPLTEHYLFPSPTTSIWSSGSQIPILIKAYTSTTTLPFEDLLEAANNEWSRLKDELKNHIRNSLPEASKDYQSSQHIVAEEGSRWFSLTGAILKAHEKTITGHTPIPDILTKPSMELLQEDVKLLEGRRWKPFGAALILKSAIKEAPFLFKDPAATEDLFHYLRLSIEDSFEDFLKSSSNIHVLSSIVCLGEISDQHDEFQQLWTLSVRKVMEYLDDANAIPALSKLLSSTQGGLLAQQNLTLQTELIRKCLICAVGATGSSWELFTNVVANRALNDISYRRLAKELTNRLLNSLGQPNKDVIKALQLIAEKTPELLSQDEEIHMSLMTGLLSLSENPGYSAEVGMLQFLIENPSQGASSIRKLVEQNINNVGQNSLSVETIAQQAIKMSDSFRNSAPGADDGLASFLPDTTIWRQQLSHLMVAAPNPSLALTNSLGDSCFLVTSSSTSPNVGIQRDSRGCSISGRMAMYMVAILSSRLNLDPLDSTQRIDTIVLLSFTAELASDQLTVMGQNQIWDSLSSPQNSANCELLVDSVRQLIASLTEQAQGWRDGSGTTQSSLIHGIIERLIREAQDSSPWGFYYGRVLHGVLQGLTEKHGFPSSGEQWLSDLGVLKSSPSTLFPATAIIKGLGEPISNLRTISTFCNRLVSEVTDAKVGHDKTLAILVLLCACMELYEIGELPVANNRLVFAVRQITSWFGSPDQLDYRFAATACHCLQRLLPSIKDVYGSYWEMTINFCVHLWTMAHNEPLTTRLPGIHASLRLITILQSLEEPNDDLVDALETSAELRSVALVDLIKLPRGVATQPLSIVDSILCRKIGELPLQHISDLSDIYGLVASDFRTIQMAAFTILNKAIPKMQEQLAVDVLLEKQDARLPDELLSLLLDPPTLDSYSEEALTQFPTPIRSYLFSWYLVFDAFQAASYKMRGDYNESLKTENYIGPLMDFMFDVLGHSAARGINLERANFESEHIRHYDLRLAESEPEERNMQWLLIHIFYLVLKYVPGLFKTWYLDCRSKQTKIAVEAWMTRYFSPVIISEALDDVVKWNESQEAPADDEKELLVKVSRAAREVIAGYEVDELNASIAVRIPPEFPLEAVTVVGINRVAVNERKWQSWILTTQGVITFSGGNIIDGLTAFRRNVIGALKGQTECAICYSIISSDKKMPDKRCQTCKNLFHRTCLYKWFQSSNQNTCPLCRNPIDYLGADTKTRK
ncbi:hypothetical protein F5Y16DRAFT_318733 [Xylariaceae sp. FL0255]|nr:hypothetical protein F5Y16DRAFT_318733 [Xylariaceae sp. FL0255]